VAALARAIAFDLMPKVRVQVTTLMHVGPDVKVNGFMADSDTDLLFKPARYLGNPPIFNLD